MTEGSPTIIVIDEDRSFRRSMERLLRSAGLQVQGFGAAREFLRGARPDGPACVVLDVCLPGLGGLDVQRELARVGVEIPLIFMTAHGEIPMSVQAMKAGAVDFLTKPFREEDLFKAIDEALQRDRASRQQQRQLADLRSRYESLTPREREVMACVVAGWLNKQTAAILGTSEKTVKFHRGHIMRKMKAQSVADLVRMAGIVQGGGPSGQLKGIKLG